MLRKKQQIAQLCNFFACDTVICLQNGNKYTVCIDMHLSAVSNAVMVPPYHSMIGATLYVICAKIKYTGPVCCTNMFLLLHKSKSLSLLGYRNLFHLHLSEANFPLVYCFFTENDICLLCTYVCDLTVT